MEKRLPEDFKEFLRLLGKHRVKYLLIGGHAVGHYGYVRNTADLDIWIERSEQNANRMVRTLQDFGFGVDALKPELFLDARSVVRMGISPLRLEVLTDISGVTFDECYPRAERVRFRNCQVKLISYDDLIKNKLASGRHKDLADVEELERKRRGPA